MRVPLVFVAGAVVAFALTGCFGGSEGGEKRSLSDGPLTGYLYELYDEESIKAEQLKLQEAVAVCMKEQGFEYTPYVLSSYGFVTEADPMNEEWVSENGYGFFTFSQSAAETADPNDQYREGLSESEKTAYREALYGEFSSTEGGGVTDSGVVIEGGDPASGGCFNAGSESLSPFETEEGKALEEELSAFHRKTVELQKQVSAEVGDDWASCMEDAGYSGFTDPSEAAQKFYTENSEFLASGFDRNGAEAQRLKKLEIDTALADLKCAEESGYNQKLLKAQFEREEQFVKDHQSELDALREVVQENKKK